MATYYVRNWGNDSNDGLSESTAFRTISGAKNAGGNDVVNVSGVYYEHELLALPVADSLGMCIIDADMNDVFDKRFTNLTTRNVIIRNFDKIATNRWNSNTENCFVMHGNDYRDAHNINKRINNSIFLNVMSVGVGGECCNNTFKDCSIRLSVSGVHSAENNIFCQSKLEGRMQVIRHSLFINTEFKFAFGNQGADETEFSFPAGNTDNEKLADLRQRMSVVYGGSPNDYLKGCKYYTGSYNDIFVDADSENFDLVEGCPASHMSYEGTRIGACPVGRQAAVQDCSLTNIDVNGNIVDQNENAQAVTPIMRIGYSAEITSIKLLSDLAYRNGQQANTESTLGNAISAGSNVLTAGKVYQCHDHNITLDNTSGTTLQAYENYTAVDEGGGAGLGFSGNGVMREVFIDKSKPKIQLKCSQNDSTLSSANLITLFINEKPMVNLNEQGEPQRGNADIDFNPENAEPLSTDYYQMYLTIQANDLTVR